MHEHEPEAAESEPRAPATPRRPSGGAGLYASERNDGFPRWAGVGSGLAGLVFTILVGGVLLWANPAFSEGRAAGTADQIGRPKAKTSAPDVAPGSPAAEGKALIGAKGCGGCHVVPGVSSAQGSIGPTLAGVGAKTQIAGGAVQITSPADLKAWLLNPQALKPGTQMPNVGLTDEEAEKLVAYLELLK